MESYDRLFPNQDTMPRGGFGNLIALPLQYEARNQGNTVFLDDRLGPYTDQWAYLAGLARISPATVEQIAAEGTRKGQVVGVRSVDLGDEAEDHAPWTVRRPILRSRQQLCGQRRGDGRHLTLRPRDLPLLEQYGALDHLHECDDDRQHRHGLCRAREHPSSADAHLRSRNRHRQLWGTPANNDNGDIQKLFRIAGNTFSVRVDVTSNTLTIPTFGPSNSHVFNAIHHPPATNSMTAVDMGFYYLQCSP